MIEKVNPSHPDKVADRIAGAIVDLGYLKSSNPKIAVEILLGHGDCNIIIETSEKFSKGEINSIVERIGGKLNLNLKVVRQDPHLASNQDNKIRCGDNGIFKGVPLTNEEKKLSSIARSIYKKYPSDGKYVLDKDKLIICQSNAKTKDLEREYKGAIINPLGEWVGGSDVDCGATNRKLGSDMGHSVTGGGLHGKDLSKADVAINIYAFLKAQKENKVIELSCAIGDEIVDGKDYKEIVEIAGKYISEIGGFEKLAEWGLY
jgi:S-adenosylmethionine synthetase